MKKIISALLLTTLLAGCAGGNEELPEENEELEVSENVEEMEDENEQENELDAEEVQDESHEVTEEDTASASDEEMDEAEEVDNYADAGELSKQDFFDPEEYDGHLITDNEGTRIFIFRDGDQQMYKTIFIKNNVLI